MNRPGLAGESISWEYLESRPEVSIVSSRLEFVTLAMSESTNIRVLCRRFRVCPTTAYKWIRRSERDGPTGLEDQSRRPHYSPKRSPKNIESQILAVRDQHPSWGGRKIQDTVLQVRPTIYTIILEVLRDLHMLAQFEKMQLVIVHI